jgi:cytochrome c peroxidase
MAGRMDPACRSMMGGMDGGGMGGGMGDGGMGGGGMGNRRVMLGRMIFCDTELSKPSGQSCASCHGPDTGFTGPTSLVNATSVVYPGAGDTPADRRFGNRKPPSAAYATPSPNLHFEYDPAEDEGLFVGGLFWDGRATGWRLAPDQTPIDPATEQAIGPFLNPAEQNFTTPGEVVAKVCAAPYGNGFRMEFGADICSPEKVEQAYVDIGRAVAAFEASPMVNRFSSKYDRVLRGQATLTAQERKGLALFTGKGKCSQCHPAKPGEDGSPPIFTDNTFDNLGLPRNPQNPFYKLNPLGEKWVDPGLGGFLASLTSDPDPEHDYASKAAENEGKQRVPTLRNVDKRPSPHFVKAYGHNGVFKSLKDIVHFYNTRDVLRRCDVVRNPKPGANCWPAPEVADNINRDELGNLGLKDHEEEAIVAFLKTLSDE